MSVIERTFVDDETAGRRFDYQARCNELACHSTKWLVTRHDSLEREERRARTERLAVLKVLDDRRAAKDVQRGVSERTARDERETARRLEHQPDIASAAHNGDLSDEQLTPLSELADESDGSDEAEWAERGPNISPSELRRMARTKRKPTPEDGAERRNARDFGMWWRNDMLHLRGALPDVDGKEFETAMLGLIERMKPAKGQPWDTFGHRGADALMELVRGCTSGEPANGATPHLFVQVPLDGPAEIVPGIPIDDATVEALRARGLLELVLVDDHGVPIVNGRATPAIPNKIRRAVLLRDGHRCRWPGCERTTGLDVHHMVPRSFGGTDDISNLLTLCKGGGTRHHQQNIPQGEWALIGNPNLPDGLRRVHCTHPDAPKPPGPPRQPGPPGPPRARAGPSP